MMSTNKIKVFQENRHPYFIIIFYFLIMLFILLSLSGCYKLFFRPVDERNIRNQFHLPGQTVLLSLESVPELPGWFGREGLYLSAIFQFDDKEFQDYLITIEKKDVWIPVSFINYSPSRADSYSKLSLRWSEWPPPLGEIFLDNYIIRKMYEEYKDKNGKYYCSILVSKRGRKIQHSDDNYHYEWTNESLHCSELPEDKSAIITTFGVLDFKLKRLYAYISFSG